MLRFHAVNSTKLSLNKTCTKSHRWVCAHTHTRTHTHTHSIWKLFFLHLQTVLLSLKIVFFVFFTNHLTPGIPDCWLMDTHWLLSQTCVCLYSASRRLGRFWLAGRPSERTSSHTYPHKSYEVHNSSHKDTCAVHIHSKTQRFSLGRNKSLRSFFFWWLCWTMKGNRCFYISYNK